MAALSKGVIKAYFLAIHHGELENVREQTERNPELVNSCAAAPPKKDDGQSPLQVSLKTGEYAIAEFLIERGANIHFMEESEVNEWRAPVLHDAIRSAVFSIGLARGAETAENARAGAVLNRILELGADTKALDSYGNNGLMRAMLDIRQFLSQCGGFPESVDNKQMFTRFKNIVSRLMKAGADPDEATATRRSARELLGTGVMGTLLD